MTTIRIEIPQEDGRVKLHLIDPSEDVQKYTVTAFFGFCKDMALLMGTAQSPHPEPRLLNIPDKQEQAAGERPYWYDTGIKFKEDVPHYRARYWCKNPECLVSGNQYIKLTDKTTECHECGSLLKVRPATGNIGEDGVPERDAFGNFFRADKPAKGARDR